MFYIYAVCYSPERRSFAEEGFPNIPIPGCSNLFRDLITLGRRLAALHLLDEYEEKSLIQPETRFVGQGEALVNKGYPEYRNGKVMINPRCHFEDITTEVWNFHIGGYQVCEKWLKDRAGKGGKNPSPGRILTEADILHYRRITIAIRDTIRIMKEIDEIIDQHGGWPEAFRK